jgi:SagB-type dehydrogenase family enzyme
MDRMVMHASLRCGPDAEHEGFWLVSNLSSNRTWRLDSAAVGVLLAFGGMSGRTANSVCTELSILTGVNAEWIEGAIRNLRAVGLVVLENDPEHQYISAMAREWGANGWRAAFDHHLATFDYPFLDYAGNGVARDRQRMKDYATIESYRRPRPNHPDGAQVYELPSVPEGLGRLQCSSSQALLGKTVKVGIFDRETIAALMATTFGYLTPPGRRGRTTRTSPSGGARHPIEAYLIAIDVADMAAGTYHVAAERGLLNRVGDLPEPSVLDAMFPGFLMATFPHRAMVVFTALFERNAYRYREPRTYRTIFMDAGHLSATLELAARSAGLRCFIHHGMADDEVERFLGLAALEQGVVGGAALGGGRTTLDALEDAHEDA